MHPIVTATAMVAGPAAVTLGALAQTRRRLDPERATMLKESAGLFSALLGGIYGVLLAFLVVAGWDELMRTHTSIDTEASRVADLSRLALGFSPEVEKGVRKDLLGYLHAVVESEWPALAEGRPSPRAHEALSALWRRYRGIDPQGPREEALYAASLDALTDVSDARRQRIETAAVSLSALLWVLLWGGAALVLAMSLLLAIERTAFHTAMVASLAVLIGVSLFLVHALDNPFRFPTGVSADRYATEIEHVSHPQGE
jgi:hypothetical protein